MNCGYNDGLHKKNGGIKPTIMGYNGIKWETPIQQYDNCVCVFENAVPPNFTAILLQGK